MYYVCMAITPTGERIMDKLVGINWHLKHDTGPVWLIAKRCSPHSFVGGIYYLGKVIKYSDGYRYQFKDKLGERGPFKSRRAAMEASYKEFNARVVANAWPSICV